MVATRERSGSVPAAATAARPAAERVRARLALVGALLLDAAEQAGHTGQAGADDAGVELDEGPEGQVGVVVAWVRGLGPAGEEFEADDGADGYEEAE